MEENNLEDLELLEDETETTENTEETEEIDVEALKKENATLRAQKEHWREKATKKPETKEEVKDEPKSEGLSQKDVLYVAKIGAEVNDEDLDEMIEYSRLKKISLADAHKFYKPILKEREEERKTALATQTKSGPRASSKDTPDVLIDRANKGEEIDPDKLAQARINKLVNRK